MCVLSLFLCSIDLLARSSIHANACAGRRAELHGKKRRDFEVVEQIGGAHSPAAAMDAVANQAAGVYKDALHGANSRIFAVKLLKGGSPTGCGGKKLVLKVCINVNPRALAPNVSVARICCPLRYRRASAITPGSLRFLSDPHKQPGAGS
jgi:hypothetical protein